MMKNQQIFVTVLVLSICQWSVIAGLTDETSKGPTPLTNLTTVAPTDTNTTTSSPTPPPTTTTVAPTTTTTTTTSSTTSSTTPSTTTSSTTPTPSNSTTVAPSTTPKPTPAPHPCGGFSGSSFIGGIVLTIGMIAIGFVAHKIYKSKFDRNYHTL
ncbi:integumentary mucin C.1-like [Contarinia nasturtii]|uniref:integumentary mucin C.1-like n=1 Tax=Contarinia nasturtii TaxID=265458 RepID=UPI0012D41EBB|nr:integumentary mucin C.1-like [Contarinia nasturtii]XP_031633213.1 integumentary mucin C.1-like [Contarinia nasturtii]